MPLLLALLVLFLSGCASYQRAPRPVTVPVQATTEIVTDEGAVRIDMTNEIRISVNRLGRPPQEVWPALLQVYADLEMPIGVLDATAREVGNRRLLLTGRLGNEPLSRYLNCGSTAGVVEVANSFRIEATLLSAVLPGDEGTARLQTRLTATAQDRFTSTPPRRCASTGFLERRIAAEVRQKLGLPASDALATAPTFATAPAAVDRPLSALGPEIEGPSLPEPAPPLALAAGGAATGLLGVLLGSQIDTDCDQRCLNARGALWPLVGGTVMLPLGVHIANGRKGSLRSGLLAASSWGMLGAVLAGVSDQPRVLWVIAPGQLITTVIVERATTRTPGFP